MFNRRKIAEVKKVIDVKFEVKEDFEADKESCSARLMGGFKRASTGENRKMPVLEEINKISAVYKKVAESATPCNPFKGGMAFLVGGIFGCRIYCVACLYLEISYVVRAVWCKRRVDLWCL